VGGGREWEGGEGQTGKGNDVGARSTNGAHLGSVPHKYDLLRAARVHKRSDALPRLLVLVGGSLRKRVDAPMDVGVAAVATIKAGQRVDDQKGLLRCGGRVEVHQGLVSVDSLVQDGEVGAEEGPKVGGGGEHGGQGRQGAATIGGLGGRRRGAAGHGASREGGALRGGWGSERRGL